MNSKDQREVVALIPMRHESVRVSGKNYRQLGGRPLFHHILDTLERCPSISRLVIDTDSGVIREDVRANFPRVTLLDRPKHLCGDEIPMTEVLYHDVTQIAAECYLQTHSTNPFLRAETIEAALACWREVSHVHDSLFSVTRMQVRLWDSAVRPVNHNPSVLLRTQDLPPLYMENSNLYVFTADLIKSTRRRIGDRPKMFEIDPLEALDIDDEQSFALAEQLMHSRKTGP